MNEEEKKKRYKTIVEIQSNIRETRPPSWTAILYKSTIPRGGGEYPEGNSCFSIYHISWIKMKKKTSVN